MRNFILFFSLLFLSGLTFAKEKVDDKTKEEILKVLESNEALHASFFEYDGKKVEDNAAKTSAAISKISNAEMKKLLEKSAEKLDSIKADTDRKINNTSYHQASMALIYIINKYDLGDKYSGYRCPMVRKQWVQNTAKMEKVHNPYAPEMPHCGGKLK